MGLSLPSNPVRAEVAIAVVVAALAANVALGFVVRRVGLPIYLDTIGTVLATVLLGWRWGCVAAAFSVVLGSLLIWPQYFWYSATAFGIVASVEFCWRIKLFASQLRTVWSGLIVATVAAFLSAPVTLYFQASTFSGNDMITAFFRAMGNTLLNSIIMAGLSSEPVDKVLTCLIVFWAIKGLPSDFFDRYKLRGLNEIQKNQKL